jgi:CRISPR-associated protein Csm5
MSLKTIYDLTLSTLTPLHVGSGETLEKDFDYAIFKKRTWVMNTEKVADAFMFDENGRYLPDLETTPPAQLLKPGDFDPNSSLFHYVMPGTPHASTTGAAVQAHIKDVFSKPYLPGSSIKGALRTIIFREAYAANGKPLDHQPLERSPRWAAQKLERALLGKDANHDLMRAVHVTDSQSLPANDYLQLLNAHVFGRSKVGSPIALECVKGDAVFKATLTIDDYLFQDEQAQQQLRFTTNQETWLRHLAQHANDQAHRRIKQEMGFYQARQKEGAARFYRQLASLSKEMPTDTFLLQVGWGGGWDSKTVAYLLSAGEKEAIIDRYNLAKGKHHKGQPFPASRRAVSRGEGDRAQAAAPLGWLLVQMSRR